MKNKGTNPILCNRPLDSWVKIGRRAMTEGSRAPSELAMVQRGPLERGCTVSFGAGSPALKGLSFCWSPPPSGTSSSRAPSCSASVAALQLPSGCWDSGMHSDPQPQACLWGGVGRAGIRGLRHTQRKTVCSLRTHPHPPSHLSWKALPDAQSVLPVPPDGRQSEKNRMFRPGRLCGSQLD